MTTRQVLFTLIGLTVGLLLVSAALFERLPEQLPSHWNIHGQIDGWTPRLAAVLLAPGFVVIFGGLLLLLPRISPIRYQIDGFRPTYNWVVVLVALLFTYIHLVTLLTGLNPAFPSGRVIIAGIMFMLAAMGNVMGKVRRNFWMGIRTPWTLADDGVWDQTHRLAAWLMTGTGLVSGVGTLLGFPVEVAFGLFMAGVLAPVFYSLVLYKQKERAGTLQP